MSLSEYQRDRREAVFPFPRKNEVSEASGTRMAKLGPKAMKALFTLSVLGKHARGTPDWTRNTAIFSTLVMIGLVALYILQHRH